MKPYGYYVKDTTFRRKIKISQVNSEKAYPKVQISGKRISEECRDIDTRVSSYKIAT